MGALKPYGYCHKHKILVDHTKFISKCRSALGGTAQCKHFARKVPKGDAQKKGNYSDRGLNP